MGMLDNRVAIVTGAGRGIGAEVSKLFAANGASVVVNDLGGAVDGSGGEAGPADETVATIRDAGGSAVANYTSVADYNGAEGIIQQALDEYGRLDILVNVAGNLRDRMVFNMTEEEWDAVVAVHMKGTFNTTKYASIYWRANREGPLPADQLHLRFRPARRSRDSPTTRRPSSASSASPTAAPTRWAATA